MSKVAKNVALGSAAIVTIAAVGIAFGLIKMKGWSLDLAGLGKAA